MTSKDKSLNEITQNVVSVDDFDDIHNNNRSTKNNFITDDIQFQLSQGLSSPPPLSLPSSHTNKRNKMNHDIISTTVINQKDGKIINENGGSVIFSNHDVDVDDHHHHNIHNNNTHYHNSKYHDEFLESSHYLYSSRNHLSCSVAGHNNQNKSHNNYHHHRHESSKVETSCLLSKSHSDANKQENQSYHQDKGFMDSYVNYDTNSLSPPIITDSNLSSSNSNSSDNNDLPSAAAVGNTIKSAVLYDKDIDDNSYFLRSVDHALFATAGCYDDYYGDAYGSSSYNNHSNTSSNTNSILSSLPTRITQGLSHFALVNNKRCWSTAGFDLSSVTSSSSSSSSTYSSSPFHESNNGGTSSTTTTTTTDVSKNNNNTATTSSSSSSLSFLQQPSSYTTPFPNTINTMNSFYNNSSSNNHSNNHDISLMNTSDKGRNNTNVALNPKSLQQMTNNHNHDNCRFLKGSSTNNNTDVEDEHSTVFATTVTADSFYDYMNCHRNHRNQQNKRPKVDFSTDFTGSHNILNQNVNKNINNDYINNDYSSNNITVNTIHHISSSSNHNSSSSSQNKSGKGSDNVSNSSNKNHNSNNINNQLQNAYTTAASHTHQSTTYGTTAAQNSISSFSSSSSSSSYSSSPLANNNNNNDSDDDNQENKNYNINNNQMNESHSNNIINNNIYSSGNSKPSIFYSASSSSSSSSYSNSVMENKQNLNEYETTATNQSRHPSHHPLQRRLYQDLPLEYWERSEECKDSKSLHMQRIDALYDCRRDFVVMETTLWKQDTVLETNMFPYLTPPGIQHYTLWSIYDLSHTEIVDFVDTWLTTHKPHVRRWQYDDNSGERSVPLFHVHVFIETIPYSFTPHPDRLYIPPHATTAVNNNSSSTFMRSSYGNNNNNSNHDTNASEHHQQLSLSYTGDEENDKEEENELVMMNNDESTRS